MKMPTASLDRAVGKKTNADYFCWSTAPAAAAGGVRVRPASTHAHAHTHGNMCGTAAEAGGVTHVGDADGACAAWGLSSQDLGLAPSARDLMPIREEPAQPRKNQPRREPAAEDSE